MGFLCWDFSVRLQTESFNDNSLQSSTKQLTEIVTIVATFKMYDSYTRNYTRNSNQKIICYKVQSSKFELQLESEDRLLQWTLEHLF